MAEYGFTSSDISSLNQARAGLSAGFMQLGKQIEEDITRIATIREMKAFGAELANLDPTNDAFPQQLLGTMSKYPMAIQTPLAKQGIEVLGNRYHTAQQAKQSTALFSDIGGGTMFNPKTNVAYRTNEAGVPEFIDTTPQDRPTSFRPVTTSEGVMNFNPSTGKIEGKLGDRPPPSMRSTNLNVLPQNVKMQLQFLDEDAKAVQIERQKLVDAITTGRIPIDDRAGAQQRQKQLEAQLQGIKDTRDKILQESISALPTGARQGIGGPSLMPFPQSQSNYVPMAPAAPNAVPNPSQMVLNTPDSAVLPENLPVLPTPQRTAAEVKAPRLYRKVGNEIKYLGNDLLKAVQQARNDDIIDDEEGRRVLEASGLYRRR